MGCDRTGLERKSYAFSKVYKQVSVYKSAVLWTEAILTLKLKKRKKRNVLNGWKWHRWLPFLLLIIFIHCFLTGVHKNVFIVK